MHPYLKYFKYPNDVIFIYCYDGENIYQKHLFKKTNWYYVGNSNEKDKANIKLYPIDEKWIKLQGLQYESKN